MPSATSLNQQYNRLWMPFSHYQDTCDYPPIVIERGHGISIIDIHGKEYIDAIGSWWVSIFGHNNPVITDAVRKQLDKLEHVMMAGRFVSEPALHLSLELASILPAELTRTFYSDDGSTAVEVALKIALQFHALKGSSRCAFVSFDGGYHGDTLGAMSVGMIPQYHKVFHERFKKQHFADSPYCYRCPCNCNQSSCNAECMDSLETILENHGDTIAACIFEPMVQGAVGMRIYPAKVLKRIFSLCRKYEILTIADEVAMGFGRTGKLFACEHAGVTPDIMCIAKGLTGGYLPLSATVVKEFIFEQFCGDYRTDRIFNHGHTFTGNPLAAAAACAAVGLIKSMNIPASLESIAAYFHSRLKRLQNYDVVGDIRTLGMVGAVELVHNKQTKTRLPAESRFAFKLSQNAINHGLLIRPLGDILYFMPPYIITEEQIDTMIDITCRALEETINECLPNL